VDDVASQLNVEVVDLSRMSMSPYDYEHRNRGDDFEPLMRRALEYDHIIIGSPVYWYSVSPPVKVFLDRITDFLDIPELVEEGRRLRGKTGHIVCTSIYDNAPQSFISALTDTFTYLGMQIGGTLHANCRGGYSRASHDSEIVAFARQINVRT
jgi:multimeric flavodoxin WrbA